MRSSIFALTGLLLLGACATEHRWALDAPPAPPPPPPHHQTTVTQHAPLKPPATVPSAGPLKVAMVGNYMDAQEKDFRLRLRGVPVMRVGDDLIVSLRNDVLFREHGLSNHGRDTAERLAELLRHYDHSAVQVGGYSDTAESADKSLALSQERAKAFADALIADGVANDRVSSQGYGAAHLKIATGPQKAEPRNRRIEIHIIARPQA